MTNLFDRPRPKDATIKDIEKSLEEITDWDWTTGYTFGHIVIDDKNLEDGHILFCLNPNRIAETMNQVIKDRFGHIELDKLEPWDMGDYEDIIRHMAELVDLLNWLLNVPIEIRQQIQ